MRALLLSVLITSTIVGCVPAKKYNELVERDKQNSAELEKYKMAALDNEAKLKDYELK